MEAILATLKAIIDNFGSAIIVPFIIFIIALIFKVKVQKAFLSALYAGVSLMGFTLILGAFTPIITPMVKNMSQVMAGVTGVNLNTFDVGWQATSVVAFATSAGMIYLGLGILLQTILFLVSGRIFFSRRISGITIPILSGAPWLFSRPTILFWESHV